MLDNVEPNYHVAFVLNKLSNGGAQKASIVLANKLVNSGIKVTIFLLGNEPTSFIPDEKIKLVNISPNNHLIKSKLESLKQELDQNSVDLVICPMHFDTDYLWLMESLTRLDKKVIVVEHASYFYPLIFGARHPSKHFQYKLKVYKKISQLWCVSIKDSYIWHELGVQNVITLPNIFEPENHNNLYSNNNKNLIYVGRLQRDKGVDWLIDNTVNFLLQNREWKLLLFGQGNQEKQLKDKVHKYGLADQILFMGYQENTADIYKNACISIIPAYNETFSYVLAESKSYGIPSLIRNMPFNDLVSKTKGHLTFDNESYIPILTQLSQDESLRKQLSNKAFESIQNTFSWDKLKLSYLGAIQAAIKGETLSFDEQNVDKNQLMSEIIKEMNINLVQGLKELENRSFWQFFDKKMIRYSLSLLKRGAIKFLNDVFDILPKRGTLFVDWYTMPELLNTLFPLIKGKKYYIQSGKCSKLSFWQKIVIRRAKLIVLSSETSWLKNVRKGQKRIFINHGCGAFKRVGFDMNKNYSKLYGNYDALISSSSLIKQELSKAYLTREENIFALGIPRTDKCFDCIFLENIRKKCYQKHPELLNKTIYLFAPTFRKEGRDYVNFFKLNWEELSRNLKENELFIISPHPHILASNKLNINTNFPNGIKNVFLIDDLSTFDLSVIADTILTDYSSSIFEAILLDKKIGFYAEDLEEYERGFYFDYKNDGPAEPFLQQDSLSFLQYIRSLKKDDRYYRFKDKQLSACDGNSTQRVLNLLESMYEQY